MLTPPPVHACPKENAADIRHFVLRCLHQVKSSILLYQLLPLPGLNQTVDHSSQCVAVQTEAPPTAALRETGSFLATAHKKRTNLNQKNVDVTDFCLVLLKPFKLQTPVMF